MIEHQIQTSIMEYLRYAKNVAWAMRANAGKMQVRDGSGRPRWIQFAPAGTSDIIGMLKGGRMFAIEVKAPERIRTATTLQKEFLDKINQCGGIAFIACSIDDVINNLK